METVITNNSIKYLYQLFQMIPNTLTVDINAFINTLIKNHREALEALYENKPKYYGSALLYDGIDDYITIIIKYDNCRDEQLNITLRSKPFTTTFSIEEYTDNEKFTKKVCTSYRLKQFILSSHLNTIVPINFDKAPESLKGNCVVIDKHISVFDFNNLYNHLVLIGVIK